MNRDTKIDGWSNYETSTANLWLNKDAPSYHRWRDEAREQLRLAAKNVEARGEGRTTREIATCALATLIQQSIEEEAPELGSNLYAELLGAALSQVDWREIAEDFFEDLEPPTEVDDEEDEDGDATEEELRVFETLRKERRETTGKPLFSLGETVTTPGALDALTEDDTQRALSRHHGGDWGDVCREDWIENELSLKEGFRLFSVFHGDNGTKFWIITEADRSVTTILLPDEN